MKYRNRKFLIKDIDHVIEVNECSRKEIFAWLDDFVENLMVYDIADEDSVFEILYRDGLEDRIDMEYDGHKIKRYNIYSMVYSNPMDYCVYGPFEMNEYGVVHPSFEEEIDDTNIEEIT